MSCSVILRDLAGPHNGLENAVPVTFLILIHQSGHTAINVCKSPTGVVVAPHPAKSLRKLAVVLKFGRDHQLYSQTVSVVKAPHQVRLRDEVDGVSLHVVDLRLGVTVSLDEVS